MLCSTDWDDFPWMYFYNVESTYLIGLDPTYLRNRYRDAYWAWVDASTGRVPRPSTSSAKRLPCAYVLSDRDHSAFLDFAANDPDLERVLDGERAVFFRVRRSGLPPLRHPKTQRGDCSAARTRLTSCVTPEYSVPEHRCSNVVVVDCVR